MSANDILVKNIGHVDGRPISNDISLGYGDVRVYVRSSVVGKQDLEFNDTKLSHLKCEGVVAIMRRKATEVG